MILTTAPEQEIHRPGAVSQPNERIGDEIMKTQLIAALLIAGSVIAAPAFAGSNTNDAPFPTFSGASTQTRAEVKGELVAAVQEKDIAPEGNRVDPSAAAIARQIPSKHAVTLAQTADIYTHP
jgi:hypothetical protein